MSKTLMDLDDDLLTEAVKYQRRQEFIDAIKTGSLDFSEIVDATGPKNPDGTLKRRQKDAA
jgi:hypothetical protein